MFCGIQGLIRLSKKPVGANIAARNLRHHADAERYPRPGSSRIMSYPKIHNGLAKSVSNLAGAFTVGLRQDNGKLFATISRSQIGRSRGALADDGSHRTQTLVATLMAVLVVEELEMIHIGKQQGQRFLCSLRARPFHFQCLIEGAPIGQAGQSVLGRQGLQGHFRPLLVSHVAQGFDHRDQIAVFIVDGAGVNGQIQVIAQLRHHAPVLGAEAEATAFRNSVLFGVEFVQLVLPPEGHQIRQAISALLVEGTPVPGGAQDFGCGDAGEPLASAVPDHDASLGVNDEGRDDQIYPVVPPVDSLQDIRSEMFEMMIAQGVDVEVHHHEVANAGQCEIGTKFETLVKRADWLQILKYTVWNVADAYGKTATFMPKPIVGDNGSGMHVHQSVWRDGKNLFAGDGYSGLSEFALYYIGGIIKHARALNAITNPGTNSYKRLVPGFEAPVKLAYSARNRSASIRIPYVSNPKGRRIEVRFPDPTANPYLAFSAMLMAGLDGVQNKIHPGDPADKNLYDLPPEENAKIPTVCSSLEQALDYLDKDREFLTRGGVFSNDMIDAYMGLKMEEVTRFLMTTHPVEFDMYYSL